MAPTQTFLNILLAMIHPGLYSCAATIVDRCLDLKDDLGVGKWSKAWRSKFLAICLVLNRVSPVHRDGTSSSPFGLDFLISLGPTKGLTMNIPELGAKCSYGRGTILAFSGRGFEHGLEGFGSEGEWEGGRLCMAQFMCDEVFSHFNQKISLAKLTQNNDGGHRVVYPH